jgi:peptide deformylase
MENMIENLDGIIKIDTGANITRVEPKNPIEIFDLVSDKHPALHTMTQNFDFANPPVDPNKFASSLVETCKMHNALGLSANQCGFNYRVFVAGSGDSYVAFFNPAILSVSAETSKMEECCLSFPDLFLNVERPTTIEVVYQDFSGIEKIAKFTGLTARCFQHELDHMNGVCYTNRVKPLAMQMALKKKTKLALQRKHLQKKMINTVKAQFNANKFRSN